MRRPTRAAPAAPRPPAHDLIDIDDTALTRVAHRASTAPHGHDSTPSVNCDSTSCSSSHTVSTAALRSSRGPPESAKTCGEALCVQDARALPAPRHLSNPAPTSSTSVTLIYPAVLILDVAQQRSTRQWSRKPEPSSPTRSAELVRRCWCRQAADRQRASRCRPPTTTWRRPWWARGGSVGSRGCCSARSAGRWVNTPGIRSWWSRLPPGSRCAWSPSQSGSTAHPAPPRRSSGPRGCPKQPPPWS
jgi:hypothetical protein